MTAQWTEKARAGDLAGAVVDFIDFKNGQVTFTEIAHAFAEFMPVAGDVSLRAWDGVVLWEGLSHELAQLIETLIEQDRIWWFPSSELVYMRKGETLDLPVWPRGARRQTQWLPVVFDLPVAA